MKTKIIALLALATLFAGCINLPSRKITIKDESGNPVREAFQHPQPISLIGHQAQRSSDKGRLKIYKTNQNGVIKLKSRGYQTVEIPFEQSSLVIMKKNNSE